MKWRFVVAVLGVCWFTQAPAAVTVKDDTGANITLARPAQRIVSLAPHITENLYAAGAGGRVVGVTSYSDYPLAAKSLTRIGDAGALDVEAIVALRPDLIVAWKSGNPARVLETLRRLGIPIYLSEPTRLEDIPRHIAALGTLAGTESIAAAAVADFRARLTQLRAAQRERQPLNVFLQIWERPLMTINRAHIINEVIEICGGKNIFRDLPTLTPEVSPEAVLLANPHAIIATVAGESHAPWLDPWRRLPQLQAVKRGTLYAIKPDIITRPTPRLLKGAQLLCTQLHEARARLGTAALTP